MYLQITTKCNMRCQHCCYSCNNHGRHMPIEICNSAIDFIRDYGEDYLTIGGGEPTMHPKFFTILERCLNIFEYVWIATNGSKTKRMYRLYDILMGYDENKRHPICCNNDRLTVCLSVDMFHDPIDPWVSKTWVENSRKLRQGFEIRDVAINIDNISPQGRAKRNGIGNNIGCVCNTLMVLPSGSIKMCGCTKSPIIGNICDGISEEWSGILQSEEYSEEMCYKAFLRKGKNE